MVGGRTGMEEASAAMALEQFDTGAIPVSAFTIVASQRIKV